MAQDHKYSVLIVDDDPLIREAYTTILEAAEFGSVSTAKNGEEGLRMAKKIKPDLIILDIIMPEVDGIGFLREYNPQNHPESKIIILSNSATADNITTAFGLGVRHYLIKTDLRPREVKKVILDILES